VRPRSVAIVLAAGGEHAATALALAERLLARHHRVTVYAHADATALSARGGILGETVARLLRLGLHGGTLDWVVDETAAARLGTLEQQTAGVVPGGPADLWGFVREADLVLAPGRRP
jgi:hypothetical protein